MKRQINGKSLELAQGDITEQQVDALVNAANSLLAGGGGVDGAIHRAGGGEIMAQTRRRYPDGCPTGSAVITSAGDLAAKSVIHAVGPVWRGGVAQEEQSLAGAYRAALDLARQHDCISVALPSLSTGAYRYPIDLAAKVALRTAIEFLQEDGLPALVRFVLFDAEAYETFAETLSDLTAA